jgi:hypothetical protein
MPEESRIAEILGASAAVQNLPIQENADVIAVTYVKPFHLIAIRLNDGHLQRGHGS